MGQTLLANQFVAGLRPDLKRKLIGVEGALEDLILKARFEEAKSRELESEKGRDQVTPKEPAPKPKPQTKKTPSTEPSSDSASSVLTTGDTTGAVGTRTSR